MNRKLGMAIKIGGIAIGAIGEGICVLADRAPTEEMVTREVTKQMTEKEQQKKKKK